MLGSSVSHVCCQAVDESSIEFDPLHSPLSSWQNSRCWRETVSLKEAEEVEEKLGPGRESNSGSLELIFQYCDGENPKEITERSFSKREG